MHTTVVDAAGTIYVIGGYGGGGFYGRFYINDVWASTDGGARTGLGRGWSGGIGWVLKGVPWGYPRGRRGVLRSTRGVLEGFSGGA